jgi:hypothetical protein
MVTNSFKTYVILLRDVPFEYRIIDLDLTPVGGSCGVSAAQLAEINILQSIDGESITIPFFYFSHSFLSA